MRTVRYAVTTGTAPPSTTQLGVGNGNPSTPDFSFLFPHSREVGPSRSIGCMAAGAAAWSFLKQDPEGTYHKQSKVA